MENSESFSIETTVADGIKRMRLENVKSGHQVCSAIPITIVSLSHYRKEHSITLIVQMQNTPDLHYRMGRDRTLRDLMVDYCHRKGYEYGTLRFLDGEGKRLSDLKTPKELGMEDYEIIDAFSDMYGGSSNVY